MIIHVTVISRASQNCRRQMLDGATLAGLAILIPDEAKSGMPGAVPRQSGEIGPICRDDHSAFQLRPAQDGRIGTGRRQNVINVYGVDTVAGHVSEVVNCLPPFASPESCVAQGPLSGPGSSHNLTTSLPRIMQSEEGDLMSPAQPAPLTKTKTKTSKQKVVTVKVGLRGAKPPIWRRLVMPASSTLADLHRAIQAAMGWRGGHLHHFDLDGEYFGDRSQLSDVADERRKTLNAMVNAGWSRFSYTYDFGDDWEHIVTIEKVAFVDTPPAGPICIAGKRACPPEECGGIWGYYHLLEVLAEPGHPEHEDLKDWVDGDFDPDAFELDHTNVMLGVHAS
jgi:hypothetical protein